MKIGLYFGSFNPVHNGHLIIAQHVLNETALEKVWFVVSPQNPFKEQKTLLNEYDRLHLITIAIEGSSNLKAVDFEFKLPKPSYTINTLAYLYEKHPEHEFSIIMGSDSYQNIDSWKNAEQLQKNYFIYIYERPGFPILKEPTKNITVVNAPMLEVSATHIRNLIQQNKSIRFLVPDAVKEEIERNNYYKLKQPAKK